jgi:conjugal transfer mating pair stabilization protein TraG
MDSLGLKASGTVGSGISKSNSGSDSLLTDLNKAITTQLSENSGLSEQMSKAASQVNSDQFAQTNAFKEAASKMNQATQTMAENLSTSLSTNASANTGMTLDSRQSVNLDRFSDSIRNKNFSDDDVRNFARKMVLMRMRLWINSILTMTHLRPALSWDHNSSELMRWWQRHATLVSKKLRLILPG